MVESSVEKRSPLRLLVIILLSLLFATVFWLGATVAFPGGMTMFAGKRPTNIGVQAGKLAACPSSPNCVSSQSQDAEHKIEPLTYNSTTVEAMAQLKKVIESEERTKIISETPNYLYAEFTSKLMGFVDDVEFYLDEAAKVIHVRSASRLGQSDLGVNRKRIETIRAKLS
ncbi:DUF1499 domain-containing protein [Argonema antarcticum]|uniref:DUF1499 domain-containing protein n=1 Tax=Argonema antarcticum TaxID=2942763 RepID=UPI002012BB18|nr:DUF1499 domain-containing protein [Argonema antarcticum]MCL1471465.1 DUF1499 domain-containing protein [Argonema antarcticum A004/B2]